MLHYHKRVCQLLKDQWHSCPSHSRSSCRNPPPPSITSEASVEGQFDDLGQDPYDPLKTPTNTPIQDESIMPVQDDTVGNTTMSTVVTEEENHLLDNVSVVSSQGKRRQANFTSPTYCQEELLNRGDVTDFSSDIPSRSVHTRHHAPGHATYYANSITKGDTANEFPMTNTSNTKFEGMLEGRSCSLSIWMRMGTPSRWRIVSMTSITARQCK